MTIFFVDQCEQFYETPSNCVLCIKCYIICIDSRDTIRYTLYTIHNTIYIRPGMSNK